MLKNIPAINCLRGIAASMVCLHHFVNTTTGYITDNTIHNIFRYGENGVHIFFVISGIVIPISMIRANYNYNNFGTFLVKRFARLEPPYLVSIVLAIFFFKIRLLLPASTAVDLSPSSNDLLLHVGYLIPFTNGQWALPVYWTLAIEFQYYFILAIMFPLLLSNKYGRYFFYAVFLTAPFLYSSARFFPLYAPIFLVGISYALMIMHIIESRECCIVIALCLAVSVMLFSLSNISAVIIAIITVHFFQNLSNKPLNFLGDVSYSLYLIHLITGSALINILSHKYRLDYQKPLVITLGYATAICCSYFFYKLVEKPSMRLSQRLKYTKQ